MAFRIGEMHERFTVVEAVETTDAQGGQSVSWTDGDTVWGQVRWEPSREALQAGALRGVVAVTLLLHADASVSLSAWRRRRLRRLDDGVTYEVLAARETGAFRQQLELDCVEAP